MLRAVLLKGNPRFVKTDLAEAYYNEIIEFMENLGVEVIIDPGAPHTCPPKAHFYVAHSRACDRQVCFEDSLELANFIMFGVPDGICHPKDRAWFEAGAKGIPVNEHFIFTADQKLAIENKVTEMLKKVTPVPIVSTRQSSGNRPGVRR